MSKGVINDSWSFDYDFVYEPENIIHFLKWYKQYYENLSSFSCQSITNRPVRDRAYFNRFYLEKYWTEKNLGCNK